MIKKKSVNIFVFLLTFMNQEVFAQETDLQKLKSFLNVQDGVTGKGVTVALMEHHCETSYLQLNKDKIVYTSPHFNRPFQTSEDIRSQLEGRPTTIIWMNDFRTIDEFKGMLPTMSDEEITLRWERIQKHFKNGETVIEQYFSDEECVLFLVCGSQTPQREKDNIQQKALRDLELFIRGAINEKIREEEAALYSPEHGSIVLRELLRFAPGIKIKLYSPKDIDLLLEDKDVNIVSISANEFESQTTRIDGVDKTEHFFIEFYKRFENSNKLIVCALGNLHKPLTSTPMYQVYQWAQQAQKCTFLFCSAASFIADNILGPVSQYLAYQDLRSVKSLYINAPGFALSYIDNIEKLVHGSSFAAPYVAAAAAHLQSKYPQLNTHSLAKIIVQSGRKEKTPPKLSNFTAEQMKEFLRAMSSNITFSIQEARRTLDTVPIKKFCDYHRIGQDVKSRYDFIFNIAKEQLEKLEDDSFVKKCMNSPILKQHLLTGVDRDKYYNQLDIGKALALAATWKEK